MVITFPVCIVLREILPDVILQGEFSLLHKLQDAHRRKLLRHGGYRKYVLRPIGNAEFQVCMPVGLPEDRNSVSRHKDDAAGLTRLERSIHHAVDVRGNCRIDLLAGTAGNTSQEELRQTPRPISLFAPPFDSLSSDHNLRTPVPSCLVLHQAYCTGPR